MASTKPQQVRPSAHLYDPERTYRQSEMMNFSWTWPANFLPDLAQYTSASTLRMEMFCWKGGQGVACQSRIYRYMSAQDKVWKDAHQHGNRVISSWWDYGPFLLYPWLNSLMAFIVLTILKVIKEKKWGWEWQKAENRSRGLVPWICQSRLPWIMEVW